MDKSGDSTVIALSKMELGFLCNAINETLEAIEEWEFPIRTGESREFAGRLMAQLSAAYREVESDGQNVNAGADPAE